MTPSKTRDELAMRRAMQKRYDLTDADIGDDYCAVGPETYYGFKDGWDSREPEIEKLRDDVRVLREVLAKIANHNAACADAVNLYLGSGQRAALQKVRGE